MENSEILQTTVHNLKINKKTNSMADVFQSYLKINCDEVFYVLTALSHANN